MRKRWMQAVVAGAMVMLVAGVSQARREGLWTMELKHRGFQHIIADGKNGPEVFYYVVYEAINNTGATQTIQPQAKIVTETGQAVYATPNPAVAKAISAKHTRACLDILAMSQEKIENGQSRHGVLIFAGLDDNADHLDMTILGLSNEYKYENEDARTGFMKKVYEIKMFRPGDMRDRQADKITVEKDEWIWLPLPSDKAGVEKPAVAPAEAPAAPAAPAPAAPAEAPAPAPAAE